MLDHNVVIFATVMYLDVLEKCDCLEKQKVIGHLTALSQNDLIFVSNGAISVEESNYNLSGFWVKKRENLSAASHKDRQLMWRQT